MRQSRRDRSPRLQGGHGTRIADGELYIPDRLLLCGEKLQFDIVWLVLHSSRRYSAWQQPITKFKHLRWAIAFKGHSYRNMVVPLRQVAIYSESDRLQPHRYKADESYSVGAPDAEPVQAYLDIEVCLRFANLACVQLLRAFSILSCQPCLLGSSTSEVDLNS